MAAISAEQFSALAEKLGVPCSWAGGACRSRSSASVGSRARSGPRAQRPALGAGQQREARPQGREAAAGRPAPPSTGAPLSSPTGRRRGGLPLSASATRRNLRPGGGEAKSLKDLKKASQGQQDAGPRAGLLHAEIAQAQAATPKLAVQLHLDARGDPVLRVSGPGLDMRGWLAPQADEDLVDTWAEDDDLPEQDGTGPDMGPFLFALAPEEASPGLTLGLPEEFVDVWDEDDGEPAAALPAVGDHKTFLEGAKARAREALRRVLLKDHESCPAEFTQAMASCPSTSSCAPTPVPEEEEEEVSSQELEQVKARAVQALQQVLLQGPHPSLEQRLEPRKERLNRDFACHFVQGVMDGALTQASHVRAALECDTTALEVGTLAVQTLRLQAALERQLEAPAAPAAAAAPPAPAAVPPAPPRAPPARWAGAGGERGSMEFYRLEAGLDLQLEVPATPARAVPASPAPRSPPSRLAAARTPQQPAPTAAGGGRYPREAASAPAVPAPPAELLGEEPVPALQRDDGGAPASRPLWRGGLKGAKSHRRIIGGVVRTPVTAECERAPGGALGGQWQAATQPSPQPRTQTTPFAAARGGSTANGAKGARHARQGPSSQQQVGAGHRGGAVVFRMDFEEPSLLLASPEGAAARGSSLASRYEALGAELFSMQDEADFAQLALADARLAEAAVRRSLPTPARSPSTSALAMDLGEEAVRPSSFARVASTAAPPSQQSLQCLKRSAPSGSQAAVQKSRPQAAPQPLACGPSGCSAAGSPVLSKKQGLLPDLPGAPCTGSLAWSRRLSRTSSRRGDVASVF